MSRTLSAAIQSEIARSTSHVLHLLSFGPVNGTAYYFAEDQVIFNGNTYLPHLLADFTVRYTQKIQMDPVTVKLQNVSLDLAAVIKAQQSDIQGAPATLLRFFPAVNDTVTLCDNIVTEVDVDEQTVQLTLADELDPTAGQIPPRVFSPLCDWDFKDVHCGYTDGVDPNDPGTGLPYTSCPKDFTSCTARGRTMRFPGFIHISRDLTLAYEGQAPNLMQPQRVLASLLRPWEQV